MIDLDKDNETEASGSSNDTSCSYIDQSFIEEVKTERGLIRKKSIKKVKKSGATSDPHHIAKQIGKDLVKRPKAKREKKKKALQEMTEEEQAEALRNMLGGGKRKKGEHRSRNSEAMSAIIIQRWFKRRLIEQQMLDQALNEDKSLVLSYSKEIAHYNVKRQ